MIQGWYYLHINGELIYKRELGDTAADVRESDFAIALWPFDPSDREGAWRILIEGLAAGAKLERIQELAGKWGCTDGDASTYASRVNCNLFMDGNQWCATAMDHIDLQQSEAGFGHTALEAMAALATDLGYKPSKMWGVKFTDLLNSRTELGSNHRS